MTFYRYLPWHDSLSYYEDHQALIETDIETNTADVWKARLKVQMGETATAELLGS